MLRKASFIILIISLPIVGFAQNFGGGLLAGITATQVDGDGYGGYDRVGFVGGVWVNRPLSQTITIRSELKFIQKGSYKNFTDGSGGTLGYYSLRLNYIDLPFFLEYYFRDDVVPFAGISLGFLWKAFESNAEGPYPEEDIAKFRKLETSATGGVSYKINKSFSVCATMSYSIFPVRPHKGNITYRLNQGQYNNVLQFYLRYHF